MEWVGLGSARATTNMARAEGMHPATSLALSAIGAVDHGIGCTLYPNLLPGRLPRAPVRVSRFHENVTSISEEEGWR